MTVVIQQPEGLEIGTGSTVGIVNDFPKVFPFNSRAMGLKFYLDLFYDNLQLKRQDGVCSMHN